MAKCKLLNKNWMEVSDNILVKRIDLSIIRYGKLFIKEKYWDYFGIKDEDEVILKVNGCSMKVYKENLKKERYLSLGKEIKAFLDKKLLDKVKKNLLDESDEKMVSKYQGLNKLNTERYNEIIRSNDEFIRELLLKMNPTICFEKIGMNKYNLNFYCSIKSLEDNLNFNISGKGINNNYEKSKLQEEIDSLEEEKSMFEELLKVRDTLTAKDEEDIIYAEIINFEEDKISEEATIKLTMTKPSMIKFDECFYGEAGVLKNIKELRENDKIEEKIEIAKNMLKTVKEKFSNIEFDIEKMDLKNNKKQFDLLINSLIYISKPYFFESEATIDLSDQKTYKRLIERKKGGFYEYKMSSESDKGDFLIDMVFSASPIKRSSKTLAFNGDELKEIYEQEDKLGYCVNDCVYTEKEKMQIESILNRVIPDEINLMNYRINHVGQGLNSYIEINEDKVIFFDIGDTLKCSDPSRNLATVKNLYKTKNPELVILSHWDVDHILGVAECKDDIYNAVWITPDLNYATSQFSLAALRLNYYLSKTTELINVDNSFAKKKVYSGSNIKIYKSSGEDNSNKNKTVDENYCGGYSNKKNNIGLVLELEYNNKKLLSPGDSDYLALASEIETSTYNYLIVPHHGSRCGRPNFSLANGADLIVPVGENGHGHPIMEKNLSCIEEEFQISLICTNAIGDYQIEFQDDNNN